MLLSRLQKKKTQDFFKMQDEKIDQIYSTR